MQSASVRTPDLVSRLKTYLREKNPEAGTPYLGIIHRLDQPVQGILVFAKTPSAAADLSAQVQNGQMEKWYYAKLHTSPGMDREGELVDFLKKDARNNRSYVTSSAEKGAKRAQLAYEFISTDTVRIRLKTGRHHQIRVQFAHAGSPLAGDHKYGIQDEESRICLCAYHLSFIMPGEGRRAVFELSAEEIGWLAK